MKEWLNNKEESTKCWQVCGAPELSDVLKRMKINTSTLEKLLEVSVYGEHIHML